MISLARTSGKHNRAITVHIKIARDFALEYK